MVYVTLLKIVMRLTTLLREFVTMVLRKGYRGRLVWSRQSWTELTCCREQCRVTRSFRTASSLFSIRRIRWDPKSEVRLSTPAMKGGRRHKFRRGKKTDGESDEANTKDSWFFIKTCAISLSLEKVSLSLFVFLLVLRIYIRSCNLSRKRNAAIAK